MSLSFQQKTKQRIALGGKSRGTESRQDLVKRAHADREKRARERAEARAAQIIQVSFLFFSETASSFQTWDQMT